MFQQQKDISTVMDNTKNRKRTVIWFNPPYSLNVSTNIDKNYLSLLCKLFNHHNIKFFYSSFPNFRSSHPEVFLEKSALKICSHFTGEHLCQSSISIKLHNGFIEIPLRHGYFLVNLLHIYRTPFSRKTSGWLLL